MGPAAATRRALHLGARAPTSAPRSFGSFYRTRARSAQFWSRDHDRLHTASPSEQRSARMSRESNASMTIVSVMAALILCQPAAGQTQGGTLRVAHFDSPASMSLLEESTVAVNRAMMGVFNNLVIYSQDIPQNSPKSIVPELATSWAWNEEGTELTLPLRQGVKWHDGKPFTAADVKCTWDLLQGKAAEKLRINPRKGWDSN